MTLADLAQLAMDLGLFVAKSELRQMLRELDMSHSNRVGYAPMSACPMRLPYAYAPRYVRYVEFEKWWESPDSDSQHWCALPVAWAVQMAYRPDRKRMEPPAACDSRMTPILHRAAWWGHRHASGLLRRRLRLCGVLSSSGRSALEVLHTANGISDNLELSKVIDDALHSVMTDGSRKDFVTLFHDGVDPIAQLDPRIPRSHSGGISESATRLLFAEITRSKYFEVLIVTVIVLNLVVLIIVGDSRGDDALMGNLRVVNVLVNLIFTAEVVMESVSLTLCGGKYAYLNSDLWNVFDFTLVLSVWLTWFIAFLAESEMYERASFALTAFRAFHVLRYHEGISEILSAIGHGRGSISLVAELILIGAVVFAILGRELFGGSISRVCDEGDYGLEWQASLVETHPAVNHSSSIVGGVCPLSFQCDICVELVPETRPRSRTEHWDKIGFDTVGQSLLTIFSVASLDEWATIAEPILRSDASTDWMVWWFFAAIVVTLNIVGVNLLLAAVTFSYMAIRKEKNAQREIQAAYATLIRALMGDREFAQIAAAPPVVSELRSSAATFDVELS